MYAKVDDICLTLLRCDLSRASGCASLVLLTRSKVVQLPLYTAVVLPLTNTPKNNNHNDILQSTLRDLRAQSHPVSHPCCLSTIQNGTSQAAFCRQSHMDGSGEFVQY